MRRELVDAQVNVLRIYLEKKSVTELLEAVDRLVELIRKAAVRPVIRRATRPTLASKKRRLDSKSKRSGLKALRTDKPGMD